MRIALYSHHVKQGTLKRREALDAYAPCVLTTPNLTAAEVYLSNLLSKQFKSTGFNCLVLTSCSYEHITVSVPSPLPGTYKCQGNKVAESFICKTRN
ncbi:hypothetical protein GUJ93_ZPchr0001g32886 [Zizania palustris]|uniref:Uncharacterized protein n=1 Tax=Zizania palustris TaxID=103762 RepID=A0A8J5RYI7_ZIZPA|nr:hypothetical protein GUJ93_ZPchr0001g32886 [Zizania palustris]